MSRQLQTRLTPTAPSLIGLIFGGLLTLGSLVSAQLVFQKTTRLDEAGVKRARLTFSKCFVSATGSKELRVVLKRETNTDRVAELKGLLEAFPFPQTKELILENLEKRPFEVSPFLRTRALLETDSKRTPQQLSELIKFYPHDFLLHSRFAFLSMMNGSH